ncbi:MAG TPA: DNA repair protein RecN [Streptosporangiaceae bacterium]|nr:DNA repair protein RecN [Streptosporangiaceae bacterium]
MLEEVRISSLGVIDDAVLELSSGFTALTGETGAGKTMVVTALGLLFGGKADPARVRPGAERASVEGRLVVPPAVARQVEEAGGDLDDDGSSLVLSRTVSAEGRSRAYAGGRSVPVSLLQVLADDLVAVHGQADQRQLLKAGWPRDALDRYGGAPVGSVLTDYRRVYGRHREVVSELSELRAALRDRLAEAEALRFGLGEVEAVSPVDGEDVALLAEEQRLANADALHGAASTAHEALLGDPAAGGSAPADAVTLLGAASRALEAARSHDQVLASLADRLSEASYLVSDVAAELASYTETVDFDPARLAAVQERRAALGRLIRAYGGVSGDVAGVLDWAKQASARLLELDGDDDRVATLAAEEASLSDRVSELAGALTALRVEASSRFAALVTEELIALAMPHATLTALVSPLDDGPGPFGADEVSFRLAPHPGAPALPLHKGASGGELSRVMLAIEVVFAGADPLPTFVFDEVDAGVGGKAAVEIGRRLARLARSSQVIVVTHLPQVAAFADNHLVVEKANDGLVTASGVVRLDQQARVRELSRMLGGLEDSEYGQAHAEELLTLAANEREPKIV